MAASDSAVIQQSGEWWKRIAHLRANGCSLASGGARHSGWGNPANKRRSAVPRHTEIDDSLARKICRDLEISHP